MADYLAKTYGPDVAERYLKILATPRTTKAIRGMGSSGGSGGSPIPGQIQEKILEIAAGDWVTAAQIRENVNFPCSSSWVRHQMTHLEDCGKLERRKLEGKRLEFRAIAAESQEVA